MRDEHCQLQHSLQTESSVRALQPAWVFALTVMESESRTHAYAIGSLFSLNQSVVSRSHWVAGYARVFSHLLVDNGLVGIVA